MTKISSGIHINKLKLDVLLGWPEEERQHKQIIYADIFIHFSAPPRACEDDDLANTYCYDNLVLQIKKICQSKTFRLLEHLTYEIYQQLKNFLPHETKIHISIKKNPPITDLMGGVIFTYGDELPA